MRNKWARIVIITLISWIGQAVLEPSAIAQNLSFGWSTGGGPEQRMSIQNMTGYYCGIVADGKFIGAGGPNGLLIPGGAIYDFRHSQTNQQEIPLFALCFRDAAAKEYVGVVTDTFQLQVYEGSTNTWIITNRQIQAFGGGQVQENPPAPTSFSQEKVKMPKEFWDGQGIMQIINNSHLTVVIKNNGILAATLRPGGWYRVKVVGAYDQIPLTIIGLNQTSDGLEDVGFTQARVYAQDYGITARNLVLNDASFSKH